MSNRQTSLASSPRCLCGGTWTRSSFNVKAPTEIFTLKETVGKYCTLRGFHKYFGKASYCWFRPVLQAQSYAESSSFEWGKLRRNWSSLQKQKCIRRSPMFRRCSTMQSPCQRHFISSPSNPYFLSVRLHGSLGKFIAKAWRMSFHFMQTQERASRKIHSAFRKCMPELGWNFFLLSPFFFFIFLFPYVWPEAMFSQWTCVLIVEAESNTTYCVRLTYMLQYVLAAAKFTWAHWGDLHGETQKKKKKEKEKMKIYRFQFDSRDGAGRFSVLESVVPEYGTLNTLIQ